MTKKVVRKRQEAGGETSWSEITFERSGGFQAAKYTEPTLKVLKHSVALFKTDLLDGQAVRLFANGERVAIMQDDRGIKKVKANKANTRVTIPGRKIVKELKLAPSTVLTGSKGEVNGKSAWIFQAA